ncbi:SAP-like protein BP-73 [Typha latifolia]|uniref:SAP-like protein BP-73 n=1 Tax=Typha latifolia TaxID=4733 RepID=UPI003C2EED31
MSGAIHLVPSTSLHGLSGRATVPACNGHCHLLRVGIFLKKFPTYSPRGVSFACSASSNNHRRNPDFSRQHRGSSRGRSKQHQERDYSENIDESDMMPSKNGPLLSLTSNPRYQATAAPGRREKEIVELFRKVQAQLRERAAVKEDKKIEAAQQGQGERGTVDSLLHLLRKHSVDQRKKSNGEEDYNSDQPERSRGLEDDQTSNIFGANSNRPEELNEPDPVPFSRPASNFRRRSPVPRVKFQPVFAADEGISSTSSSKNKGKKKIASHEPVPVPVPESVPLDTPDDILLEDQSVTSNAEESHEDIVEPSASGDLNLGSLKLAELRELAKSRGIKGYSKLRKGELVELLSGDSA